MRAFIQLINNISHNFRDSSVIKNFIFKTGVAIFVLITFSTSCVISGKSGNPEFNRERAFGYLEKQVSFGPRVPGTQAHKETSIWIQECLRKNTGNVAVQTFQGISGDSTFEMQNILASFYPEKERRILLCAHWDSRPWADKDPEPSNHNLPVPGANDGASGVAVLLEIAFAINQKEPPVGIDIVFFDGEDGGAYGDENSWLLGSRHFAKVMPVSFSPEWAILLDMIGDRNLNLVSEMNSMRAAPELWNRTEKLCKELGIKVNDYKSAVLDDHIPLIERGIPSVDFIDFDYPSWHTISDTPDKCSAESLGKIGNLVLMLVYGFR